MVSALASYSVGTKEMETLFQALGWRALVELGPAQRSQRLMLLAWAWDSTAAKRAQEESELDAAEAEAEAEAGAFPVPPMDLPHYHGIGVYVERSIGASPESSAAEAKEVTGA